MRPASAAESSATGMEHAGPRLRAARRAQNLTLSTVAEEAGLTKGFLSLVERGRASMSVPNLLAVCGVLGISVGSLFDFPSEPVVDRGRRSQMGGIGVDEFVLTAMDQRDLQVMRSEVSGGGGSGGAYRLDTGTVFAYVLSGTVLITVDGEERTLTAGRSTSYPGSSLHSWANADDVVPAEVLWVFAPPLAVLP